MSTLVAFGAVLAVFSFQGVLFSVISLSDHLRRRRQQIEVDESMKWPTTPPKATFITRYQAEHLLGVVSAAAGGQLRPLPLGLRALIGDFWGEKIQDRQFIEQAITLLRKHPDPFDCFTETISSRYLIVHPVKTSPVNIVVIESTEESWTYHTTQSLSGRDHETGAVSNLEVREVLNSGRWRDLSSVQALWAICLAHHIQRELDGEDLLPKGRIDALKLQRHICASQNALPPTLFLPVVTRASVKPFGGGGFADVYEGFLHMQRVCLKVPRIFMDLPRRGKMFKEFSHEALLWRQLKHPNVLPFLGVNTELFSPRYCLISPLRAHGCLLDYLKRHPEHDKFQSVLEIASGLNYLHEHCPQIVHGDIRGANILVDDDLSCQIADFGLAMTIQSESLQTSTTGIRGCTRWLAPEVLAPTMFASASPRSTTRDIYAFGCTVLEIFTELPPFADHMMDTQVIISVLNGVRPECPDIPMLRKIWPLVEWCWKQQSIERPSAHDVLAALQRDIGVVAQRNSKKFFLG